MDDITLEQFVKLVKEYEMTDPIDFGTVPVSEHDAFMIICSGVLDTIRQTPKESQMLVLMISTAKLLLEAEVHKLQRIQYLKPLNF